MVGRGPKSFVLGQVTGLLFCLHLKLFLPSVFNSVDFWNTISRIVQDIEIADKNVKRELGVFFIAKLRDTLLVVQTSTKPQNQLFRYKKFNETVWNSRSLAYSALPNIHPIDLNAENFAKKEQKNARFWTFYWIKKWKTCMILAAPSKSCWPRSRSTIVDLLKLPIEKEDHSSLWRPLSKIAW